MSSSIQKIIEAQQLLSWGNRVAARRQLTLALQDNPHDAQLWFWLAKTLDNQGHVINALERALKYDPGLLEAQRYLDLLQTVMGNSQAPQTGRASVVLPDPSRQESSTAQAALMGKKQSSEDEETTSQAAASPTAEESISSVTIDAALEASQIRSLEREASEATQPRDSERKETGLTTKKFAIEATRTRPFSAPAELALLSDDSDDSDEDEAVSFEDQTEPKTEQTKPKKGRLRRTLGCLTKILLLLLLMGGLCLCGWYIVSYNLLPQEAVNANPAVATQIATVRENVPPFPDDLSLDRNSLPFNPFEAQESVPQWVEQAESARYNNNIQEAEEILRNSLKDDPNNIAGLLALSNLLREQPGGQVEALNVAERALDIINRAGTLEQRAQASESYVWAMARQAEPDIGLALARGEQAASETPNNAHAQWAYAMAATLQRDTDAAWEATEQATLLSAPESRGAIEAQQAEIYARLGDLKQAAQRYEAALEKSDYVPWRVTLVRILRQQERFDEAESHLDHLRELAPNDPAVQQLEP